MVPNRGAAAHKGAVKRCQGCRQVLNIQLVRRRPKSQKPKMIELFSSFFYFVWTHLFCDCKIVFFQEEIISFSSESLLFEPWTVNLHIGKMRFFISPKDHDLGKRGKKVRKNLFAVFLIFPLKKYRFTYQLKKNVPQVWLSWKLIRRKVLESVSRIWAS